MDSEALEDITKRINPQRGVESEINRVLSKNESLQKSDSWDGATPQQKAQIRERMTAVSADKGLKFKKNGKTFIRVDKGNYKRVTSKDDVYIDESSDTVWLRDSKGRFKKVVK